MIPIESNFGGNSSNSPFSTGEPVARYAANAHSRGVEERLLGITKRNFLKLKDKERDDGREDTNAARSFRPSTSI